MTERDESFWGWGYADEFSDEEERRELADMVEGFLGFPERTVRDPPTVDEAEVRSSGIEPPYEFCTDGREDRVHHTYGRSYRDLVRGFRGDFSSAPDLVAKPGDEDEIRALIDWASEKGVAVVPYGGGTSVVGGVECDLEDDYRYSGVVSLDLGSFDEVVEVDETSRCARIQAGMKGPDINDALGEHGLQLRHYPQSYEFSTLGGWIATRCGGHFATLHTRIDDFVQNVRMLTPSGEFETERFPSSGAGPDPNRLVLGSEGALGVITEAWMRVQPRPTHRARATVLFDEYDEAVEAVRRIAQARLYPSNCRLLDSDEAALNRIGFDGNHRLFVGFESFDHEVEDKLERALEICDEHGGEWEDTDRRVEEGSRRGSGSKGEKDEEDWRRSFFEAPYRFNDLVSIGVVVDTFETAVTWDRFDDLHTAVTEEVSDEMDRVCGDGFITSRLTHAYPDGVAPYYTFLAPADEGREVEQWRSIKRAASDVIQRYGGTITHHHAVGRVHRDWYGNEVSDEFLEALRRAKNALDPERIMNPGVLLPQEPR